MKRATGLLDFLTSAAVAIVVAAFMFTGNVDSLGISGQPDLSDIIGAVTIVGDSPRPANGALVELEGPTQRRAVFSNSQGTFTFVDLPEGSYRIRVTKPGLIATISGADVENGGSATVSVRGQTDVRLTVYLFQGAVVEGQVTMPNGEPASFARVWLGGTGIDGQTTVANEDGRFRFFGLRSGGYAFAAALEAVESPVDSTANDVSDGRIRELRRRASGLPATALGADPVPSSQLLGVTYYPGVAIPTEARLVEVLRGHEVASVDFALGPDRRRILKVAVAWPDGKPAAGVTVRARNSPAPRFSMGNRLTAATGTTGSAGTITMESVLPGRIELEANITTASNDGKGLAGRWWSLADNLVPVFGPGELSIVLRPPLEVRGTIEGPNPKGVRLELLRRSSGWVDEFGEVVIPSGTNEFTFSNLTEGRYVLKATPLSEQVGVEAVVVAGSEASTMDVDVQSGQLSNVRIKLSRTLGGVHGNVEATQDTGPAIRVVLFSSDSGDWTPGSLKVREATVDGNGNYRVQLVPPGTYFLASVFAGDPDHDLGPQSLEQLSRRSVVVKIDRDSTRVDIKVQRR